MAHSIGGLVAREMVLQNLGGMPRVGLIVEVGTPHNGAAEYSQVIKTLGLPGGDLVKDVLAGSAFLQALKARWNTLAGKPWGYCITSPADKVVSMDSASADCDQVSRLPNADHRGLVKPDHERDDRYTFPMNRVRSYFDAR